MSGQAQHEKEHPDDKHVLTEKQNDYLETMLHRYRRQIQEFHKNECLVCNKVVE